MAIGLLTPVKAAIGAWLVEFHQQAYGDTPAAFEWTQRPAKEACIWAASRMVDTVESMLSSWRNNPNHTPQVSTAAMLPVLFAAIASEYIESPGETGRMLSTKTPIIFPSDPLCRLFMLRLMSVDLRCQIAIAAAEQATVMSMIGQLCSWAAERQLVYANHPFETVGLWSQWPVNIIPMDRMSVATPIGEQVKVMTLDLTIRATLPMFYGPGPNDYADANTPAGFQPIAAITPTHMPTLGPPTGVGGSEWHRYVDSDWGPPQVIMLEVK